MLAGSPELWFDSLCSALPSSVYSHSKLGCFGTARGLQAMNYNFLYFSLELTHSILNPVIYSNQCTVLLSNFDIPHLEQQKS